MFIPYLEVKRHYVECVPIKEEVEEVISKGDYLYYVIPFK